MRPNRDGNNDTRERFGNKQMYTPKPRFSAETLFVNTKSKHEDSSSKTKEYKYCKKDHWSDECKIYKSLEERKKKLKGCFFRCLKEGRTARDCKLNKACVYCGEFNKHHRSLCGKRFKSEQKTERVSLTDEVSNTDSAEENVMVSTGESVLMQTDTVEVKNSKGKKSIKTRLLLDSCSQRTYVSKCLAEQLGLKAEKTEELKLVTFGNSDSIVVKTCPTILSLKLKNGEYLNVTANIVPVISGSLQRRKLDTSSVKDLGHLLSSLDLADSVPKKCETTSVDLLIGNDYYLDLILSQKIEVSPGLYLLSSKLGWILSRRTYASQESVNSPNMLVLTYGTNLTETNVFQSCDDSLPLRPNLEDFWNLESIGIKDKVLSYEDETAMVSFMRSIKFENGRYHVKWPWRNEEPDLPEKKGLAFGRLKSCLKRMKDKNELLEKYDGVIKEQLSKGIIEKVPEEEATGLKHYIPHHAVITPQKTTTKLRVVYDASAKTSRENRSLNECLYRGPVVIHDLCGLLMRFRLHKLVLVSDIEKAFLQVALRPSERDVTRFLWITDINNPTVTADNIQEYRFARVPFGVISSPFLLGATIAFHLDSYRTDLTEKLKDDIYVDNIITGADSEQEAISLYKSTKEIFNQASMNLREWLSNSPLVNEFIPSDRAEKKDMHVIGYTWDCKKGTLSIKKLKYTGVMTKPTKRLILKKIASVFDPLGLFAPVLVEGKILLQQLWGRKYDWDDTILEEETIAKWVKFVKELESISTYTLQRHVGSDTRKHLSNRLLCFCDAFTVAYATAIYLHQHSENKTLCNLLFSKVRLAPVKTMTVPKLELMAVVIGVRCMAFVKEQLKIVIDKVYLWTDSQVVIGWINSDKVLPVFVNNRIKEIKAHPDVEISYINTVENPADIGTRGSTMIRLWENQLWWHGPKWLENPVDKWLVGKDSMTNLVVDKENEDADSIEQPPTIGEMNCRSATLTDSPLGINCNRFSSVTKLLRVTALALRFIRKLRGETFECDINSKEIKEAENMWLKHVQQKHLPKRYTVFHGIPVRAYKEI